MWVGLTDTFGNMLYGYFVFAMAWSSTTLFWVLWEMLLRQHHNDDVDDDGAVACEWNIIARHVLLVWISQLIGIAYLSPSERTGRIMMFVVTLETTMWFQIPPRVFQVHNTQENRRKRHTDATI